MYFSGGFPNQEEPASDQDEIAPGKPRFETGLAMRTRSAMQAQINHRGRKANKPCDGGQQSKAQDKGEPRF